MTPTNDNDSLRTTEHHPQAETSGSNLSADCAQSLPPAGARTALYVPDQPTMLKGAPLTPEGQALAVPGYEVEGVLGRGGVGVVYKAQHRTLKRPVALKMMLAGCHAGPNELARFRLEAETVARLQHPNIVQIHEVGEANGHPYCALEFVEGSTLATKLGGKPMLAREAATLVEVLARAMQLAHSRNVVHRDLKPANILLTTEGIPKITDFGLARQLDSESGETQAGAIMGTPSFMAPEQASGRTHEAGPAADIYALGAILYNCLTGQPPFKGKTSVETLDQVRTQEPVPLSRVQVNVPLDLETICLKCLRKEPEKRYASAAELADELRRYLRGEPILARPVSRLERGWRWCRRNPSLTLLSGAFVVALLAGLVTSVHFALVARAEADDARSARTQADERAREALAAQSRADQNAVRARANEQLAFDRAYSSDLRLFQQAWDKNQFDFAHDLLNRQRPENTDGVERRGFEWDYWNRQSNLRLLTFTRHPASVGCVAFSPDGKLLASGGEGDFAKRTSLLKIWDAATGREMHSWTGKGRRVTGLAFSPEGKRLVTTTQEETAHVWEIKTGKELFALTGHTQYLKAVAWSRDGHHLATASGDFTARLWDATTGKERLVLKDANQSQVQCVAFSPDSTRVATAGDGDYALRVWEVATGKKVLTLPGHRGTVLTVAFSPNGKWLASGSVDGRMTIWNAAHGGNVRTLPVSAGNVSSVAFSPDSRRLASVSDRDGVKLWDVGTGQHLFTYKGQIGYLTSVVFSPEGKRLASADGEGKVTVWDATAGNLAVILSPNGQIQSLATSADGKWIVGGVQDGTAHVWDATTSEELRRFGTPPSPMRALAVHPRGHQAVIQGIGAKLEVWDPRDGTLLHREQSGALDIQAVAYSPEGTHFATTGFNAIVSLWSSTDFKLVHQFKGNGQGFALTYGGQGKYLALRDSEGVKIWEVASGHRVAEFSDPTAFVGALAMSPNGEQVASGNHLGMVTIWDLKTHRIRHRLTGHTAWITGLAYSPEGKRLASCSGDKSVKIWEPVAGEELLTLGGGSELFHCVAFHPNGKSLLAGADGGIRIWAGQR